MQKVTFVGIPMPTVITSRSDGEETSEEGIKLLATRTPPPNKIYLFDIESREWDANCAVTHTEITYDVFTTSNCEYCYVSKYSMPMFLTG